MKVKEGREGEFERAWHSIAERARHVPGNLRQTLMKDPEEASTYVITTEWESTEAYRSFETSPEQDELTRPLRELRESARQAVYDIVADVETDGAGSVLAAESKQKGRIVFVIRLKSGMHEA